MPARSCLSPSSRSTRALLGACCLVLPGPALALEVFACEPEWAALVQDLHPAASIHVATHARQDPHHIEARPSLIAALRRADLAVCTGAALESGWLPVLQQRAGNPKVRDHDSGLFLAARHVPLIEAYEGLITPFDGDVHPEGNPHLHLDPDRLARVAQALAARLQKLDPAHAPAIGKRHHRWQQDWQAQTQRWRQQSAPLRGLSIAVQHGTFNYLWRWLGVRPIADLEPRPGLPPSPGHLRKILQQSHQHTPQLIVTALYQDPRPAHWLSAQLPQRPVVLQLPSTVEQLDSKAHQDQGPAKASDAQHRDGGEGATPRSALLRWFDELLARLLAARPLHTNAPHAPDGDVPPSTPPETGRPPSSAGSAPAA